MTNRNKTEYKIFGVRRSGMHALIYWIAKHYDEQVWFANDLASFSRPRRYRKELDITYEPEEYISPLDISDFWDKEKNVLLSSYEDMGFEGMDWESNRAAVGGSDSFYSLLVIRDPFNLFASQYRLGFRLGGRSRALWKHHAREALGETSHLKNKIVVNYNKWFAEEPYRRGLEKQMSLGESDAGLQRVYGLGSSFSEKRLDGNASRMKVMDRWTHYIYDKKFMTFFDAEMVRMAWALFGAVPEPFMDRVLL